MALGAEVVNNDNSASKNKTNVRKNLNNDGKSDKKGIYSNIKLL